MKYWFVVLVLALHTLGTAVPGNSQEQPEDQSEQPTSRSEEIVEQAVEETVEAGTKKGVEFVYGERKALEVWSDTGKLIMKSPDGEFAWWLDARAIADFAAYDSDLNDLHGGAELRQARVAIKALLWKDWATELDVGFELNQVRLKDAYVGWTGRDKTLVKIGLQREAFSLSATTPVPFMTFMERPYVVNAFSPARHIGASFDTWGEHLRVAAGIFAQRGSYNADPEEFEQQSDGYSATGRLVWVPVIEREEGQVIHLGLSVSRRTPNATNDDQVRFASIFETAVAKNQFVNTGNIPFVDSYDVVGLDAAVQLGSLLLQGEIMGSRVNRLDGFAEAQFSGWYAFVSWYPTGEKRRYTMAQSLWVTPNAKNGIELALRYSTVSLTDLEAGVTGGSATNISLAFNYHFNNNVRAMVNLTHVDNDEYADGNGQYIGDDDFAYVATRFQVMF